MKCTNRIVQFKVTDSANILEMFYHGKKSQLYVVFSNYNVYRYDNVPLEIIARAIVAPSVGAFFHRNIKNSFPYEKVASTGVYPLKIHVLCNNDSPEEAIISWDAQDTQIYLGKKSLQVREKYEATPAHSQGIPPHIHYHEVPLVDLRL